MSPRADAVRNRQKLVDAARLSFAEEGVDVPLEQIAKRAGVSIGTLYNHFADRGELVDAVLPDRMARIDAIAADSAAEPDAWTAFATFLDALISAQARDRAVNEAVARGSIGSVDLVAECGRAGSAVLAVLERAHVAGVLRDAGVTAIVEFPPAGTLTGIAKRELRGTPTHAVKSPADLDALAETLRA